MLTDVVWKRDPIADMVATINGNSPKPKQLATGVYEIGHFSFDMMIGAKERYAELEDFSEFGVCDDYQQVIDQCPELSSPDRRFVMSVTPVLRAAQSADGGWRWHKWGPYIGTHKPTCEYLHDEPEIEKVYCYHIYEVADAASGVGRRE